LAKFQRKMKNFFLPKPTILLIIFSFQITNSFAQDTLLTSDKTFNGIKLRSIGPAFKAGRIADITIDPKDDHTWFVAAGSGGVWKTTNSGVTWKPVFDKQSSYSIGCVTFDPQNSNTVWVGTGENVGGRHVGYGDGIYKSTDGGESWKNMGLKESQHISKILVHPSNSDIVWVAAQGPLWNKGGERGIYKTTDGGKTWHRTLGDDEWVGATDIAIDPRNPDRLYAATWQRNRTVAAYMGGGPGTALYRSEDGGETWIKLEKGLPKSNMGKIGLAISPQKPDVLYAAIELDRRTGGVYRSTDRGASWTKMSNAVSGATGPHYYQELYASPHAFDRLYLADVRIQVSDDGGKTFRRLKEEKKHSDNHAIAFRKDEPEYLLVGCDGGIYESYDLAENWRFINNLPVTQFYKLAVDDAEPFYNIYGGTQDNGTQGGPVRTDKGEGLTNDDWSLVIDADGHQPATEPGNPDIMYGEWQEGHLIRVDRTTGERTGIQPQPAEGEDYERFNWDSPILVSPHSPTRLYYASQRVWRSDDRGDSWKAISDDLTRHQERLALPIMGRQQGWDNAWDFEAMSNYNTITSLAESPKQEGLIYAGTDDGLIQVTENGGDSWKKIEVGNIPGVPSTAFVNDIKADLFDANTVYVAFDNHKYGDFSPYLFKSVNKGKTWKSIKGNIPERTLVWRIVQDYVDPNLLFAATEFGIYVTIDGGSHWAMLKGGVPTISFRDLAIQRRENDLVGASFGRSFYVLDDYSFLRDVSEDQLKKEATLFNTRDAWWYIPELGKGDQGAGYFIASNPPFGAVFTYYLSKEYKTEKEIREAKEKKLNKENANIPFPGWDSIENERLQEKPKIWLTVKDGNGEVVRKLSSPVGKGFHRVSWNLRYPDKRVINEERPGKPDVNKGGGIGMVLPGTYSVSLSKEIDGKVRELAGPVTFKVVPLRKGALEGPGDEATVNFWKEMNQFKGDLSFYALKLKKGFKKMDAIKVALSRTESQPGELDTEYNELKQSLLKADIELNGYRSKKEIGEKNAPSIYDRYEAAASAVTYSTYGPTQTATSSLNIAKNDLQLLGKQIDKLIDEDMPRLIEKLKVAGAPVIE